MSEKCNGKYPIWGFEQEVLDITPIEPIANPFCEGCNYIESCSLRVGAAILGETVPHEIHDFLSLPNGVLDQLFLDIHTANEGL